MILNLGISIKISIKKNAIYGRYDTDDTDDTDNLIILY